MLDFKSLHLNLLKIVIFWPSRSLLDITLPEPKKSQLSSNRKFQSQHHRYRNNVVPNVYAISKQNISHLIHQCFGNASITSLKLMSRKGLLEGLPKNLPDLEELCPFFSWPRQLNLPEFQPLMSWNFPLGSCFIWILHFSMLKVSVY